MFLEGAGGVALADLRKTAATTTCMSKNGHRCGETVFLVEVAAGFYENPARGLRSGSGIMLPFSAATGRPIVLLQDEEYLTDPRTIAAGEVCARHFAPNRVERIGNIGAGILARLQLDLLWHVTECRQTLNWSREPAKAAALEVPGSSTISP